MLAKAPAPRSRALPQTIRLGRGVAPQRLLLAASTHAAAIAGLAAISILARLSGVAVVFVLAVVLFVPASHCVFCSCIVCIDCIYIHYNSVAILLAAGPVAQWIRHRPTEPGIAGSSPAGVIACCCN